MKKSEDCGQEESVKLNHEQQRIAEWLQTVRFRKRLLGGIDESDLWKKLEQLNNMYESALSAERARYDALLVKQRQDLMNAFKKKAVQICRENAAAFSFSEESGDEEK